MKILALRFANLNSLRGSFTVNFTDPELCAAGIFAITGPTGSGKSTILDAVTLALYGRTPRTSPSKAENELMTRGTGECRAEVDFSTWYEGRELRFCAAWRQHRGGRQKALQQQKASLQRLSPESEGAEWETETKSQVGRNIEQITGLDYDRFVRTCLLAQGQFAAFLEAGEAQRSAILEQITGTDIYSALSQAAYAEHKAREQTIEHKKRDLEGLTLLSDEAFAELGQRVDALQTAHREAEAALERTRAQIAWVAQRDRLHEQQAQVQQDLQHLEAERAERADDLACLADARRAEPVRPVLQRTEDLQRRLDQCCAHETSLQERLPTLQQGRADLEAQVDQLRRQRQEHQQRVEQEQVLLKAVRELDHQVAAAENARKEAVGLEQSLGRELTGTETGLEEKRRIGQKLQAEQDRLVAWQGEHASDRDLERDLKGIEELAGRLRTADTELAGVLTKREEAVSRVARLDQARVAAEEKVARAERAQAEAGSQADAAREALARDFPDQPEAAVRDEAERAAKLVEALTELTEIAADYAAQMQERGDAEKHLAVQAQDRETSREAAEAAQRAHETLLETLDQLQQEKARLDETASFADRRGELQAGQPCPLCGALEHPYAAAGAELENGLLQVRERIEQAKKEEKAARTAVRKAEKAVQQAAAAEAGSKAALDQADKALGKLQARWQARCCKADLSVELENRELLIATRQEAEVAAEALCKRLDAFLQAKQCCDKADKELNRAKDQVFAAREALAGSRQEADRVRGELALLEQKRATVEAGRADAEARLRDTLIPYGLVEFDETVLPAMQQRRPAWEKSVVALERIRKEQQDQQQQQVVLAAQVESLTARLKEAEQAVRDKTAAGEDCRRQRAELYGEKDPDREEKALMKRARELEGAERKLIDEHQAREVELQKLTALLEQTRSTRETLERERAAAQAELDAALRQAGFADEADARCHLPEPERLRALLELETRFAERGAELKGRHEVLSQQLLEHLREPLTTATMPELQARLTAETTAKAQALHAWQEQNKELITQQEIRRSQRQLVEDIAAARRDLAPWAMLNELIGQADGSKFRKYAQGLTFAGLIYQANEQLARLYDRYRLVNEGLVVKVVDRFMGDAVASTENLSGGERFLASLALALGLAHMVGRNHQVDTLFIDEGFGALDPETLETAIEALCSLHRQGKLIGVISHVESMKDRLPARIEVQRRGGGLSTLDGPGISCG